MRTFGLFAIVPISMFLTVSFFVLYAVTKTEMQSLKSFGRVIAVLLWISAALVLSVGIYTISTGHHPMMQMMGKHKMMMRMDNKECQEMMEKCMPDKKMMKSNMHKGQMSEEMKMPEKMMEKK